MSSPIWGSWPDIYYCLTVTVLFLWGALSDGRTGLSFVNASGPCRRSLSCDWRPSVTVAYLRLPFSSPPTTRRVTGEVFDPASTRGCRLSFPYLLSIWYSTDRIENTVSNIPSVVAYVFVTVGTCIPSRCLAMAIFSVFAIPVFSP
jgi:hypothetical protein